MLSKLARKLSSKARLIRTFGFVDIRSESTDYGIASSTKLQFSKEKLVDCGELDTGEIPEALLYDRPSEVTSLDNGVQVATEYYNTGLVTIGVHWGVGSRHETQENSSVLHFIQHLRFRGTENKTRQDLEVAIQNLGGHIKNDLTREKESLFITVQKDKVPAAFELLGDIYNNTVINENQVEAEKENVYRDIIELQRDQLETTMESIHYTSFRDHTIGQPVLGVRENVGQITADQIQEFIEQYQVGSKFVVVASGDVNHSEIEALTNDAFGGLTEGADVELPNSEKPLFTPSLMFMRDDEMANMNVGVFFEGPAYDHEDAYAMRFFEAVIGNYRADKHTGEHLNSASRNYSKFQAIFGDLPDLTVQNCFYKPFSDTGLFGNYLFGNEVHGPQMLFHTQHTISEYAYYINQAEVFRGRAVLYNKLLNQTSGEEVNDEISDQVRYLGRRVPRSEEAKRYAAIACMEILNPIAHKYFYDVDVAATAWGPLHSVLIYATYNRAWRRSTLGWYGRVHAVTN